MYIDICRNSKKEEPDVEYSPVRFGRGARTQWERDEEKAMAKLQREHDAQQLESKPKILTPFKDLADSNSYNNNFYNSRQVEPKRNKSSITLNFEVRGEKIFPLEVSKTRTLEEVTVFVQDWLSNLGYEDFTQLTFSHENRVLAKSLSMEAVQAFAIATVKGGIPV